MGLALTARDVAALEGRTEGWIVALQLAALSMQGEDVAAFIADFAGGPGYISATMRAVHDKSQPYDVPFRTPTHWPSSGRPARIMRARLGESRSRDGGRRGGREQR
jgi:hypothetical protein